MLANDPNKDQNAEDEIKVDDDELVSANIGCTDRMLEKIQEMDVEGAKLKIISKYQENFSNFENAIEEPTMQYQN